MSLVFKKRVDGPRRYKCQWKTEWLQMCQKICAAGKSVTECHTIQMNHTSDWKDGQTSDKVGENWQMEGCLNSGRDGDQDGWHMPADWHWYFKWISQRDPIWNLCGVWWSCSLFVCQYRDCKWLVYSVLTVQSMTDQQMDKRTPWSKPPGDGRTLWQRFPIRYRSS